MTTRRLRSPAADPTRNRHPPPAPNANAEAEVEPLVAQAQAPRVAQSSGAIADRTIIFAARIDPKRLNLILLQALHECRVHAPPPMNLNYAYKAKPIKMALAGLFFGACGALFIYKMVTNEVGLIINGIIELGPQGAMVFYGVLAALSLAFVVAAGMAAVHGVITKPVLILTEEHITVPTGLLRPRPKTLRFADVTGITLQEIQGQRFLTIQASTGKVSVTRSLLESESAFEEITVFVRDRLRPEVSG